MTDTEKILNLLELNPNFPSVITDDEGIVLSANNAWTKFYPENKHQEFLKAFDRNTQLLIKSKFLDVRAFSKVQRLDLTIETADSIIVKRLVISPFKLHAKQYYYVILFNTQLDDCIIYPTIDDDGINVKYSEILDQLRNLKNTLIEKKNFQFAIDSETQALCIIDNKNIIFKNLSFTKHYKIKESNANKVDPDVVFGKLLYKKIQDAESELNITKNIFVLEKTTFDEKAFPQIGRMILFPLIHNSEVKYLIILGTLDEIEFLEYDETGNTNNMTSTTTNNKNDDKHKIVYDSESFEILDLDDNLPKVFGYTKQEMLKMNMTQLFAPENMQQLLTVSFDDNTQEFDQILSNGEPIKTYCTAKEVRWKEQQAVELSISVQSLQQDVTEEKIDSPSGQSMNKDSDSASESIDNNDYPNTTPQSEFLSTLFHEMLTPVNVIMGFVQEIIDSLDNPTEEQLESAEIIKSNQQLLLQTMNTAVQFANLSENKIKFKPERFDFTKHLVDLKDKLSRMVDEGKIVNIKPIDDEIIISQDKSKLIAALVYFLQISTKLSNSDKFDLYLKSTDKYFYAIFSDTSSDISEELKNNILKVFNSDDFAISEPHGLSAITLQLSRKLNEFLSVRITDYSFNDSKVIAFTAPANLELPEPKHEHETRKIESTPKLITTPEESEDQEIIVDIKEDLDSESVLDNREVDKQIVEDIEDEKEIHTEEIATSTKSSENIMGVDLSEYSCLFIDDNLDTQLLFRSQMNDFKTLKICNNFSEALPLLKKYNFDLIIVDVNLNDTYNGFDALKIIRQFDNYKSTPVIAVTAYSFEGDKNKFLSFGFTDYFVKPILRKDIINSLETILQ